MQPSLPTVGVGRPKRRQNVDNYIFPGFLDLFISPSSNNDIFRWFQSSLPSLPCGCSFPFPIFPVVAVFPLLSSLWFQPSLPPQSSLPTVAVGRPKRCQNVGNYIFHGFLVIFIALSSNNTNFPGGSSLPFLSLSNLPFPFQSSRWLQSSPPFPAFPSYLCRRKSSLPTHAVANSFPLRRCGR